MSKKNNINAIKTVNTVNTLNNMNNKRNLQSFEQEIIIKFLEMLNVVKIYHWKTFSYATHKATDELYEELNENIDKFVEVLLGKCKERANLTKVKSVPIQDCTTSLQFRKKINTYKIYLVNLTKKLDSKLDTDLLNIRDEILGNLDKFLYLLTFK